jgi:hypothetical protein
MSEASKTLKKRLNEKFPDAISVDEAFDEVTLTVNSADLLSL